MFCFQTKDFYLFNEMWTTQRWSYNQILSYNENKSVYTIVRIRCCVTTLLHLLFYDLCIDCFLSHINEVLCGLTSVRIFCFLFALLVLPVEFYCILFTTYAVVYLKIFPQSCIQGRNNFLICCTFVCCTDICGKLN